MSSFSCFLSRKPFVSSSILSTALLGGVSSVGGFSLPSLCAQLLPTCKASAEISADNLMGLPLYIASAFSIAAFKILFLSLTFSILIIMWCGTL